MAVLIWIIIFFTTLANCKDEQWFNRFKRFKKDAEIVMVGGIFDSAARNSAEHIAFKTKSETIKFSPEAEYKIKIKIVYVDDISDSFQMAGAICQLLVTGVIGIFGPIHSRTVHTIQSLTDSHGLIYLTTSDAHHYASESTDGRRGHNIIKLRPLIANAIVDFIQWEQWRRILYLYDSNEALFRLRMIFEYTNSRRVDLSADARQYSLTRSDSVLQYINRKSKKYSQKHIILDLISSESKQKIIGQMDDLKMDRIDYHYLVTELELKELNSSFLLNGGINFTMLTPLDYSNDVLKKFMDQEWFTPEMISKYPQLFDKKQHIAKIIPYDAALIVDGLELFNRALKVASPSVNQHRENSEDLICTPQINPTFSAKELKPAILQTIFQGLTGNIQLNNSGFRYNYKIDLYEARVKESLKKIGEWTTARGLNIKPKEKKAIKMIEISKNQTLRVTSILLPPFMMIKKDKYGKDTDEYEGFCVELVKEISKLLNFSYTIHKVHDNQFGGFVNNSWNGMIGELINNVADIAVAPLTISSSRERVVDFSTPFMEFGLSVMYTKPKDPDPEVFGFMKPLSNDIWMCITFAYLGVSVVLFLVSRFNPYEWGVDAPMDADAKVANEFTIFNSFWFSLSAFMQQGGDIAPRSLAGRIVGGVWWFFTLIIVSSYTANLAAYLTVERMSNPIKSYEDLAKQNKIKYGVVDSGSSKDFFATSKIEIFEKMWQFMETNKNILMPNITAGYKKVLSDKGNYAFILESAMNDYYNLLLPCKTTKVGPNLDSGKGYGIATPPGSNLRDSVNLAVLDLKEKNRIPELIEIWWKNRTQCLKTEKTESDIAQTSVKLNDIRGLFYLLTGGLGLGLILSVLELFYKCALEARRKNKKFSTILKIMMNHSVDRGTSNSELSEPCVPLHDDGVKSKVEYSF